MKSIRALALGLLALTACGGEPRCKPMQSCNVRTRSCQRAALRQAVCLRGRDEPSDEGVEVVFVKRATYLEQRANAGSEAETEELRLFRRGLALIGLADSTLTAEQRGRLLGRWTGGTYDPETARITIIDDGDLSRPGYTPLLVHEMIHALQHRAGQLDGEVMRVDQGLANSALIEGEPTLLVDELVAADLDLTLDDLPYGRVLANYRSDTLSVVQQTRDPISLLRSYFSYAQGASYLWDARQRGIAQLIEATQRVPVSSYAVMTHDTSRWNVRENDLGDSAVPQLPAHTLLGSVHLGRFGYEVANRTMGRLLGASPGGATGFAADTFSVFVAADGSILVSWRIRYDSEQRAREVEQRLAFLEGTARGGRESKDVWWLIGEREASLDGVPDALSWSAANAADFAYEHQDMQTLHCTLPH